MLILWALCEIKMEVHIFILENLQPERGTRSPPACSPSPLRCAPRRWRLPAAQFLPNCTESFSNEKMQNAFSLGSSSITPRTGRDEKGARPGEGSASQNSFFENAFFEKFANFWRARSRLYQNEILQENMRLTAFFKLYKICILLHRCNLKIFAKNLFEKLRISQNF